MTNDGSLPTTIGTVLVSGGEASEFPLAGGTCAGATLAAGGDVHRVGQLQARRHR